MKKDGNAFNFHFCLVEPQHSGAASIAQSLMLSMILDF